MITADVWMLRLEPRIDTNKRPDIDMKAGLLVCHFMCAQFSPLMSLRHEY